MTVFNAALSHFLNACEQSDATGEVITLTRAAGRLKAERVKASDFFFETNDGELLVQEPNENVELILIDGGNTHGDAWKAIFLPKIQQYFFRREDQNGPIWTLKVLRADCKREDTWYFATENEANKARDYALNVIGAEEANVEVFDPNPRVVGIDAFKSHIREIEGRDQYKGDAKEARRIELTSVKLGTPDWVKELILKLAEPFFDEELFDHIEPCLKILRDHGATVEAYHSGGGNMHALGVIEKDGLAVLFWTGADGVGADEIRNEERNPSQAWRDTQHDQDEDTSLLAEAVAA